MRSLETPYAFAKPRTEGGSEKVSAAVSRVLNYHNQTREVKKDPAPSRNQYRLTRLWLTPSVRVFVKKILPLFVVTGVVALWFANADNRQMVVDAAYNMKRDIQTRPEFMVNLMAVDGASGELAEDIREIAFLDFPLSSFDINLPELQQTFAKLDAVEKVSVHVRTGGILQVDVTERLPSIVLRSELGVELLDDEGRRVGAIDRRQQRNDLPLIAGRGAEHHVVEALHIYKMASPFIERVRGLVRVGERRWDIVLDRDQIIQLPEVGGEAVLEEFVGLVSAQDILNRDFEVIDLRNPQRVTIKLSKNEIQRRTGSDVLSAGVFQND